MSDRKTIQINPELFKFPEKKKRESKKKEENGEHRDQIKIRNDLKRSKQKSLRRNILKMIREKQQDEYKKLFSEKSVAQSHPLSQSPSSVTNGPSSSDFNKEFESSLEFFSSLANKQENEAKEIKPLVQPLHSLHSPLHSPLHSQTLKQYPSIHSVSPAVSIPGLPSLAPVPLENFTIQKPIMGNELHIKTSVTNPSYGCLKNGSLPTYRNFTQKNYASPAAFPNYYSSSVMNSELSFPKSEAPIVAATFVAAPAAAATSYAGPSNVVPNSLRTSEILQKYQLHKSTQENQKKKIKYLKQRKIFKRTYRVGRSSIKPQIGVLVSNRTLRSRISTQCQLLKQTPIQDVRKFLIKRGFIKIGSNAPNNVLRKMYESVATVCGEVENHNPDTILFNFVGE